MRHSTRVVALSALLLLPAVATAKGRPRPITCPADLPSALAEQCPCAGKMLPDGSVAAWRNHGQYVRCVVHLRNALRKGGCLTADARQTLAHCAARSTCGKETAVLCCVSETGTCSDPAPGDGTAAGTCSNAPEMACDSNADCTEARAHIASDEAACVANGGTSMGAGSVCDSCTSSTTTSTTTTTTTTLPPPQCYTDADCQDANLCNGLEACVAGTCVPGSPALCSNGVPALWLGTASSASGFYVNIGVTLCAVGSTLTGQFECVPGSGGCLASQGTITGTIVGSDVYYPRVTFADGSFCAFGGQVVGLTLAGTYTCYDSSGFVVYDQGSYSVTRCP